MLVLPAEWRFHLPLMPSLRLGSCERSGQPCVCRALAAEALADGRMLVLLAEKAAPRVVAALSETGQLALLANSPRTNRTLHIKGRDARVEPGLPEHASLLALRQATLGSEIAEIDGFADAPFLQLWYGAAARGLAAVYFSISGAWDQTPGPNAGLPLALETAS
ncbi:MAG: hypothetical protein WBC18_13415 [Ottowia sp.]|uniref:hypothetical protein n=1 Tax=unclassified Ottowia TaxID=2645081 RepID=UPI003C2D50DB